MNTPANTQPQPPYPPSDVSTTESTPLRVLIADDEPYIRQLLEITLKKEGYTVASASNGQELIELAQVFLPHLIIVDLMMPQVDGYEAIRHMRSDIRTSHIPMLILTARARSDDVVHGFEAGADDYISKPFDINELRARVRSHLRRAARQPVTNPLSGLPSGTLLSREIRHRLARQEPFALLYIDLDNFKNFNDVYGFSRGDRVIISVGHILQRAIVFHGGPGDFIGHIGGDDFALLTTPDRIDDLCSMIINEFNQSVRSLYHAEDWQRGYLTGTDRYGILRRFRLISISIGVVTNQERTFADEEELALVAAEMKRYVKAQGGSSYAVDQRIIHLESEIERREMRRRSILILSADASLCSVLHATLIDRGYAVHELDAVNLLWRQLEEHTRPAVVIADVQLGAPLWQFLTKHPATSRPPFIVLVCDDDEVEQARAAGVTNYLRQPLPLSDVVQCVEQVITAQVPPGSTTHNPAS